MTTVNTGLNVVIETGQAASQLLALKNSLEGAAVGVARLGREIQNHSGNIQRVLGELSKHGFGGLSQSLERETGRVGAGMRRLEKEIDAAAALTGKRAGKSLGDGVSKGVKEGLDQAEAQVRGVTSAMALAARELSQLSGVNPKRGVTSMPAKDTLLAQMMRDEVEAKAFRESITSQKLTEIAAEEAKIQAFREGVTNQKMAEIASDEAKIRAFREGIAAQKLAEIASDEAKQKAFRDGISAQKLAEIASDEAKIRAFREGISAQRLTEIAADEAKQKAFREGITNQKLAEIASEEAKIRAFREGITNQRLAELAASEAKQKAFREGILNQRLAEIDREERAIAARRAQYVGRTGTLGGYASALNTQPISAARDSIAASQALAQQRRSALGLTDATDGSKAALSRWSKEAKIVHDTARGAAAGVGYLWMTWGNIGAMAAGFGAIRGVAAGIKELAAIEQQLTHAAHAGGGTVESLNSRVMSLYGNGNMMVHTAGQMSEALKNLTLAGFSTDEAFQMLTHTYKFAAAGEMDLAAAAQGVQQTMNSFRLPMSETGRVTDVLAKAAAASAVTIEDMIQAMKTGSVVGAMYNVTIEDFARSAAMLGKVGIVGQAAGTAIKNFYTEVSSPKSHKAMEAMNKFGLSFYEVRNGATALKPLSGIIDELRDKFKGLSETNQQIFLTNLNDIFNERGIKEAAQLIKMTTAEYDKLNSTMDESAGFVDALYGKLTRTTQGIFEDLKAQGMASLTKSLKDAEPAIQALGNALRGLVTSTGFQAFLTNSIKLLAGLTQFAVDHGQAVVTAAAAYAAFKVSAGIINLLMGRVALFVGVISKIPGSLAAARASMALFSTTLVSVASGTAATAAGLTGLRGALALIAGPIGIIGGLLTAGVTIWAIWGSAGEAAARRVGSAMDKTKSSAEAIMARLADAKKFGEGDLGELRKREAELENNIEIGVQSSRSSEGARQLLAKDRAELARVQAAIDEVQKAHADVGRALKGTGAGVSVPPAVPESTATKKTAPVSVKDYDAEIKLYTAHLSDIDRLERDALARSKAVFEAGLATERVFLGERNTIRMAADDRAKVQLDLYVAAQNKAAKDAIAERARQEEQARALGLTKDEATLNKITQLANRTTEAYAKAAQAREQYEARSASRAQGQVMDTLANMKDKFGSPDDSIQKAQEAIAAIKVENEAMRTLTETTRDKTLVSIEASIRSAEGLIDEAWATAEVTTLTYEQVSALNDKLGVLRNLKAEYEKQKALQKAMQNDSVLGARQGMRDYLTEVESAGEAMRKSVSGAFKGMEDALTKFVMTGKLDFKSLANSIISDIVRIQARQWISSAVQGLGSMFGFADGGVMTSSGSLPLRAYSSGGIANSPQMALYGEGRKPEAYVPLPDGRTIPVTMTGAGGGGGGDVNTSIVIHVTADGNATVTRDGASKMGQQIEAEVMKVIIREKRQGGVLSGAA